MEQKIPFWRSLRLKYAATNFIVLAVTLVLLNTYPLFVSQDLVFKSKETSMLSQAKVISSPLSGLKNLTSEGIDQVMIQLGNVGGSQVVVTDPAGVILYDTAADGAGTAHSNEIDLALEGNNVFHSRYEQGVFHSQAATPVNYRNAIIGAVYVYEADAEQGLFIVSIQSNFRNISLIIAVLTIIISTVFSNALMRRMDSLLKAIRVVRDGGYSHRIPLTGGDEITRLTENFNELTGRLETTEKVRQQFVSDASHELKTPLASIRLLSDSILHTEQMDNATAREFVSDIGNEADRLTRITEKLLLLTKADSSDLEVKTVRVHLADVLDKVVSMLSPLAVESRVTLHLSANIPGDVLANGDDLHQVVYNLVENAVKYNVPDGQVWVTLTEEGELVTVTVEDTGVGIPEEDYPKIFDRFYRVDKARSRAAGGTGLGLSIAKDLAKQHGGFLQAAPRTSGGTCFTLRFPRLEA